MTATLPFCTHHWSIRVCLWSKPVVSLALDGVIDHSGYQLLLAWVISSSARRISTIKHSLTTKHAFMTFKFFFLWSLQGGGIQMYAVLWSSSSVKVVKLDLDSWLLPKIACPISSFCKITFMQPSEKVLIVVYTVQTDTWPTKTLPWFLTFALTEDEDQSTGYIGVPPPCLSHAKFYYGINWKRTHTEWLLC